jgi:tetratricopeptide (TPR) repeat protein
VKRFFWGFFPLVLLGLVPGARSPAQQSSHQGHSPAGPVPLEILQRPVTLRTGIGELHEKVSTPSPEAQSFYDQGLAYVHSYVWIEAIRSFHQALRADPKLGMAYLGLTDAFIGLQEVGTARATLERAKGLQQGMSDRERTWLAIRESELEFRARPRRVDFSAIRVGSHGPERARRRRLGIGWLLGASDDSAQRELRGRPLCLCPGTAHDGHAADARKAFAAAEKLWAKADKDLPELEQIHKQLAASR